VLLADLRRLALSPVLSGSQSKLGRRPQSHSLLQRVRKLVREQPPARLAARLKHPVPEDEIRAHGVRTRIERTRGFGRDGVCVYADATEVATESFLHDSPGIPIQRKSAAREDVVHGLGLRRFRNRLRDRPAQERTVAGVGHSFSPSVHHLASSQLTEATLRRFLAAASI